MVIENEIFKRTKLNVNNLINYGFTKNNNLYEYSEIFMNNFRADIVVNEKGIVTGKVYDLDIDDEYLNFRVENQTGEFVNSIREEYIKILTDIRENCFEKNYFISTQANRITKNIIEKYCNEPEFIWSKFPGYGIFRNPDNEKWYGLIMNIDKGKIDNNCSEEVEVINVKLDDEKILELLQKKGFYPSYHMNKKNWITIILDDTISDKEIMEYISISHKYTEVSTEWIVPANPKYYDIINCFNNKKTILWKQSNNIRVGDMIYLYIAEPFSAILYKCEAVEVNINYEYKDKNISMNRVMKIRLVERYNEKVFTFPRLKEYGIKVIRGPRKMPEKLSKKINSNQ